MSKFVLRLLLALMAMSSTGAFGFELLPIRARDGFFRVNVYLPAPPDGAKSPASCSTYDQGRLIHHQASVATSYLYELPLSYLHKELWVRCTHPDFQDVGGELGPPQFYYEYQRGLYLSFAKTKLIDDVKVSRVETVIKAVEYRVPLPEPTFTTTTIDGVGTFQQLRFDNEQIAYLAGSEYEGMPEVPVAVPLIAIPADASVESITATPVGLRTFNGVKLRPVPPSRSQAMDAGDPEKPGFDPVIYSSSPSKIGTVLYQKNINSQRFKVIKLAQFMVNYDSETQVLQVPKELRFTIKLKNTSSCYRPEYPVTDPVRKALKSRTPTLVTRTINFQDVINTPECPLPGPVRPENLDPDKADLVILSHSKFVTAANRLLQHKMDMGWQTKLLVQDSIDVESIKTELGRIDPTWMLILGDAEFISTYYHNRQPYIINRFDRSFAAGDTYFAQGSDDRLNPGNFSIGRLPVDTEAEATQIVNRIIAYEREPSLDPKFYERPIWSANISYGRELETFYRDTAVTFGLRPKRLYFQGTTTIPDDWDYLAQQGVVWNTDASVINSSLSSGEAAILLHRGHANWYAWQEPYYQTQDVDQLSLSENKFPFILSINCSSGFFDNETAATFAVPPRDAIPGTTAYRNADPKAITLAEKFIRKADGAIGIIADTRQSDVLLNKSLAEGAMMSIYRFATKEFDSITHGRMGQILLDAKANVVYEDVSEREIGTQLLIYNLLGDPSVYLHQQNPWMIRNLSFDRAQQKGTFEIYDPNCEECPMPEGAFGAVMISARSLNGKGPIVSRTLAKPVDADPGLFQYALAEPIAADTDLSITVSGPGLKPLMQNFSAPKANLRVKIVSAPATLTVGVNQGSRLVIKVENIGGKTALGTLDGGGYMVDFVLSKDAQLPNTWAIFRPTFAEDVLLRGGRYSNTNLIKPGESRELIEMDLEVPAGTPLGRMCLGVVVDPGQQVPESLETDNSSCHWLDIVPPRL